MQERYDASRGNSNERGYDADWQKVRAVKAAQDPLCETCARLGIDKALDVVHHIKSIEERPDLRLDMDNLQSLCTEHHEKIHKAERWRRGAPDDLIVFARIAGRFIIPRARIG